MRILFVILACAFAALAQTPTPIAGQQIVGTSPMYWQPNSSARLYVTLGGYFRDSAGVRRPADSTRNSVGGPGICTDTYTILTNTSVGLQSNFELRYGVRATDAAQYGVRIYFASRHRLPSGTDTTWAIIHTVWDTTQVTTWVTPKNIGTTRSARVANLYLGGQDIRACVMRVAPMLGSGDTTIVDNLWGRLR